MHCMGFTKWYSYQFFTLRDFKNLRIFEAESLELLRITFIRINEAGFMTQKNKNHLRIIQGLNIHPVRKNNEAQKKLCNSYKKTV